MTIAAAALPFALALAMIAGVPQVGIRLQMPDNIVIRNLETMADLSATVELQKAVWGMHDVEVSSPHTLRAIVHAGGVVIAAEIEGLMVGFCFGMAAWREGDLWLWSHMAGVRPEYQGRGIGFRLKLAQREWALANGFRQMAWTFDPLQSGNANFNFNRLGVTARIYSVNHYGAMQDGINAGLASDRLEAQWQLDSPRVEERLRGAPQESPVVPVDAAKLVYVDDAGVVIREQPDAFTAAHYGIEIPLNIADLKQRDIQRAKTWQLYLRGVMTALMDASYIVSGFVRGEASAWYIMSR